MKMKVLVFMLFGILLVIHVKGWFVSEAAAISLDEDSQNVVILGEPENKEEKEGKKEEETEKTKEETEPEFRENDTEDVSLVETEPPDTEKEGKVYSMDEIGSISLCLLFCVAIIAGYLLIQPLFKRLH